MGRHIQNVHNNTLMHMYDIKAIRTISFNILGPRQMIAILLMTFSEIFSDKNICLFWFYS